MFFLSDGMIGPAVIKSTIFEGVQPSVNKPTATIPGNQTANKKSSVNVR